MDAHAPKQNQLPSRDQPGPACLGSSGDQPKIWVLTRRRTDLRGAFPWKSQGITGKSSVSSSQIGRSNNASCEVCITSPLELKNVYTFCWLRGGCSIGGLHLRELHHLRGESTTFVPPTVSAIRTSEHPKPVDCKTCFIHDTGEYGRYIYIYSYIGIMYVCIYIYIYIYHVCVYLCVCVCICVCICVCVFLFTFLLVFWIIFHFQKWNN